MLKVNKDNVRKKLKILCLSGIVICLLMLIPQIRQVIINMTEYLLGRELRGHAIWHRLLRLLSIIILLIMSGLLLLIYLNYKFKIDFIKYIMEITNNQLYSGEKVIQTTEKNIVNVPTLMEKLKVNGWLVFSVCSVFLVMLVFFAVAHPVVPYNSDDWYYLGRFRHPFPNIREWNPSRVFPEVITPFVGLLAAFIVKPIMGEYISSITITVALAVTIFGTFFYWSLYKLFLYVTGDKWISILSGLMILCLYFVFFKTQEKGNQYMLHALDLCTYFFYTIPNLLNSILICVLMRFSIQGTYISVKGLGRKDFFLIALALYFAIFSMLYSAIILAVYCFWQLLLTIKKKEKLRKNLALIIILIGFAAYMILEFTGERAAWGMEITGNYSFFSIDYLKHCGEALRNLLNLVKQVQMGILIGTLFINSSAIFILRLNWEDDKGKPLIKIGMISLLSFASLTPAMVLVAGRTHLYHTAYVMYIYGIFFYYILFSVISLVYVLVKIRIAVMILPFLILLLFLEATNTNKPYSDQSDYFYRYFGYGINTQKKIELTNNWIEQIKIADKNRDESVTVYIPEYSQNDYWPVNIDILVSTLYEHGIISRKMKIITIQDMKMTEEL